MDKNVLESLIVDVCAKIQKAVKDGDAGSAAGGMPVNGGAFSKKLTEILEMAEARTGTTTAAVLLGEIRNQCSEAGLV